MGLQISTGVFNQALWPGIGGGPRDDCWVLADYMGAHAVAPELGLPSIARYRELANIAGWKPVYPDTDATEGGALEHSLKAIRALWPDLDAELYRGTWEGFLARCPVGHCASVSVLAGRLPARLRYGFTGNHRILLVRTSSGPKVLDPLARAHSKAKAITLAELRAAMAAYPDAEAASAIIFHPGS